MPLTVESENSTAMVVGSPVTLAAPTTSAIRVVRLDLTPLTVNEIAHLRVQTKVRTAGTIRDQYYMSYPVGTSVVETPPITADLGVTATLTQIGGSAQTIDWKILTFGAAPVIETENTQVCTVGTPHTLSAPTTNKTRVLRLDLNPLIAVTNAPPESLRVQIQTKVRAAGTLRNQFDVTYTGPLGPAIVETVPISADLGATYIITQLTGTSRSIDWKLLTLD